MAKIYTRVGDDGETALFGGGRVRKDDLRVEALGTVDELNAALGVVQATLEQGGSAPAGLRDLLAGVQHRLFDLGAEVATPRPQEHGIESVSDVHVTALEAAIDRFDAPLAPLRAFILPGGSLAAAHLHLARCICRRAERRLVQLAAAEPIRGELIRYLNRLSDLLFVLARAVNHFDGRPDIVWQKGV
jgi:cob(I)alamin adenosyltransferase